MSIQTSFIGDAMCTNPPSANLAPRLSDINLALTEWLEQDFLDQPKIVRLALAFARLGLRVCPLDGNRAGKGFKSPWKLGSGGWNNATTDVEKILSWDWSGSLLGAFPCSIDHLVIDIDEGLPSDQHRDWIEQRLGSPASSYNTNGTHKGTHHWYRIGPNAVGCDLNQEDVDDVIVDVLWQKKGVVVWSPEILFYDLLEDRKKLEAGERQSDAVTGQIITNRFSKETTKPVSKNQSSSNTGVKPDASWWLDASKKLNLAKKGKELVGPCPDCGGTDRFHVTVEGERSGLFGCRKCEGYVNILKAAGWEIRQKAVIQDLSEMTISEAWVQECGQDWKFVVSSLKGGNWARWTGSYWKKVHNVEVFGSVRKFITSIPSSCPGMRRGAFATGVEKFVRDQCLEYEENFDNEPLLLNCPDGVIDLQSGNLIPHDPRQQRFMQIAGASPAKEKPKLWLDALNIWTNNDSELQKFFQVLAGLMLRGDNIAQIFAIFIGVGSNGKSIFVDTISKVLKDYASTASSSLFKKTKHDQHPTELYALKGSRFVIVPELGTNFVLDEELLKRMTGNDLVSARAMRQDPESFRPMAVPVLCCNQLPAIRDVGISMQRRALIVPFDTVIQEQDQDPELDKKLEQELPAIFNWMIEGHLVYLKEGLVKPQCVQDANTEYFHAQDQLGRFFTECLVQAPDASISVSDVYQRYRKWAESQGEFFTELQNKFSKELHSRYPCVRKVKKKNVWHWVGLDLNF